jgi:hypothetical protein
MAELFFVATTIFVAYVIFVVIGGGKEKPDSGVSEVSPPPIPEPTPEPEKAPIPPVAAKPAAKPAAKKPKSAPAKAASAATTAPASSDSLKNPKTGEVAKLTANYAFAKRWIKDALVEEGLLDKVYKNNELDSVATAKINEALQKLKAMQKYQ